MAEDPSLIVSISGIRGIVDHSLTPAVVRRYAAAFGTWLGAEARVVLARDTRPSGERLCRQAAHALGEAGCEVFDLGVCPTPSAKLMVTELQAAGAVIVTASHNPAPWNGLKLIRSDGIFLNGEQGRQVEAIFTSGAFRRGGRGGIRQVDRSEASRRHLQHLLARIDVERVRRARLKVCVDLCNGAGAVSIPPLLDRLGVEATYINAEPNGLFAHDPEPAPANLGQLRSALRAGGSAAGFAVDPDADRVALVGERGESIGEDYTLALAVDAVTSRRRGPVVTTLSTSQAVSDAARAHQCPVFLTPVGEIHVVEKMLEERAVVGGEGNGGVILTEVHPGRDAAVGVAIVLEALARSGRPLSALVDTLPAYHLEKRKTTCSPAQLERAITALRQSCSGAFVHPVKDGSKLYLKGELVCPWIHLRASNTEPVVRICAESEEREEASRLCDEVEALIAASA